MPKPWFDGAERVPSHRANPMAHNSHAKKLIMHTTEGDPHQSAKSLAQYVVNEAKEYSAVINAYTGEIAQIYPINTGARSAENGGVDNGIGCNRSGEIAFQVSICGATAHGEELIKEALKHQKVRDFFKWIHEWGVPAEDLTHHDRSLEWFHKSGILCHGDLPHNSHTDRVPVGPIIAAMKGDHSSPPMAHAGSQHQQHGHHDGTAAHTPDAKPDEKKTPPEEQHYVVLAKSGDNWFPVGEDNGEYHLVLNEDNWAVKEKPHIRPPREGVKPRLDWAVSNGHTEVKVLKLESFSVDKGNKADAKKHQGKDPAPKDGTKTDEGLGDVRLQSGAIWPDDPTLMHKLHELSKALNKPIMVVSGLRRTGSPGDLKRNVQPRTQWYFWELFQAGRGNLAARPGTSQHEQRGPGKGAADTDVVTGDGKLVSLGNYPGGYAAARKLGLHFTASGEAWHISCGGPDRWHP